MGLEDRINRLFIRIVMGGKRLKNTEKISNDKLPETTGSVKKFFEWGLKELKKDIMKMKNKEE